MLNCKDCEFFREDDKGRIGFGCDPFRRVKEPECLQKWTLLKLESMVQAYQATLQQYRRLAPLQEKMMKQMERELDNMDESDKWKIDEENDEDNEDQDDEDAAAGWEG